MVLIGPFCVPQDDCFLTNLSLVGNGGRQRGHPLQVCVCGFSQCISILVLLYLAS